MNFLARRWQAASHYSIFSCLFFSVLFSGMAVMVAASINFERPDLGTVIVGFLAFAALGNIAEVGRELFHPEDELDRLSAECDRLQTENFVLLDDNDRYVDALSDIGQAETLEEGKGYARSALNAEAKTQAV
jgi:hypothetical protein